MIAALLELVFKVGSAARMRRTSASVSPAPSAPIWRKFRRLTPSQKRCFSPQNVSMTGLRTEGGVGGCGVLPRRESEGFRLTTKGSLNADSPQSENTDSHGPQLFFDPGE